MNRACILTVGDEILLGQMVDTNTQWIANQLALTGLDLVFNLSCGDTPAQITRALDFCFSQADVLVVTGGLGPTRDDVTKQTLADWFGTPLKMHPLALEHLEERMRSRGRPMNELVMLQALHPESADYLLNKNGSAPGIWFYQNGKICTALPGVPYEMKQIFTDEVLPRLKATLTLDAIQHRFLRTVGVPETTLALRLKEVEEQLPSNIKLAYLPSGGQVKLRLTARGKHPAELEETLRTVEELVYQPISEFVYARTDTDLQVLVADLLKVRNVSVVLDDRLSEGRFAFLLNSAHQSDRFIVQKESVPDSEPYFDVRLWKESVEVDSELQWIEVSLVSYLEETLPNRLSFKTFPVPELNRNMVSLRALDLMRRTLEEADAKLKGQRPF